MNLRTNRSYRLPWLNLSGEDLADLPVLHLFHQDGSTGPVLTGVQNLDIPDVYTFGPFVALADETWQARVIGNSLTLEQFSIMTALNGNVTAAVLVPITLSMPLGALPTDAGVTYRLIAGNDPTGSVGPLPATYSATPRAFVADATHAFDAPCLETVVWFLDGDGGPAPFALTTALVDRPSGQETLKVNFRETGGNPHEGALMILSDETGAYVTSGVIDYEGLAYLLAPPGQYTLSAIKGQNLFNVNNFPVLLVDTELDGTENRLLLQVDCFSPTVPPAVLAPPTCVLFADLFRMNGTPLANADVQVSVPSGMAVVSGVGAFDARQVFRTDGFGHVEFALLRGIEIEVVIAPLGVRRRITVPTDAGPHNFLTLMEGANDPFTIIRPDVTAAPRREL